MNLSRVILASGSFSLKSFSSRSCHNVAKQLMFKRPNTSIIPRRQLMSSMETGGIRPYKPKTRIKLNQKLLAGTLLALGFVEFYFMCIKEEEINKMLGVEWNTAAVGLLIQFIFAPPLAYILFAATLPW